MPRPWPRNSAHAPASRRADFPVENIINDGTTTSELRLGSVADLNLVLRVKGIRDSDIMVVAGDMLFHQVTSYKLQAAYYKLQVTSHKS